MRDVSRVGVPPFVARSASHATANLLARARSRGRRSRRPSGAASGSREPERARRLGSGGSVTPSVEPRPARRRSSTGSRGSSPRQRARPVPPGRRTRAISAAARSMSGTSISPKRQTMPSTESSSSERCAASSTANSMPVEVGARRASSRNLDHLRCRIGREQLAVRLDQRQRQESELPGAGCELEDPAVRARDRGARPSARTAPRSPGRRDHAAAPNRQRRCPTPRRALEPHPLIALPSPHDPRVAGVECRE